MRNKLFVTLFSLLLCFVWLAQTAVSSAAGAPVNVQRNQPNAAATPIPPTAVATADPALAITPDAAAQVTPTPMSLVEQHPLALETKPENVLSFQQLGKLERVLQGPYDSWSVVFSVPEYWQLTSGAELELFLGTMFSAPNGTNLNALQRSNGTLTVAFNGVTVAILHMQNAGEQYEKIALSDMSLTSIRKDGRHELTFVLDSGINCDINQQFDVVLRPTSRFTLPHDQVAQRLDLSLFPRPFSRDAFWPDSAVIVVPAEPSAAELQSAMTVSAGLANLLGKSTTFSLNTEDKLTDQERAANHLILVGKSASLQSLGTLALASPVSASGYAVSSSEADGVIQLLASPWNVTKVVLLVSGGSDEGVVKAAQGVSSGFIQPNNQPNVAVVSSVEARALPVAIPVDQTLEVLGYVNGLTDKLNRPGLTSQVFEFLVPPGQVITGDAYFKLSFSHSALINFSRSGLVMLLNDQPIGSYRFTQESGMAKNMISFTLPGVAVLPGRNLLEVRTNLFPMDDCTSPQLAGLWYSIWPDSLLHLPLAPVTFGSAATFDLSLFPAPFTLHPNLGNTALVVAKGDITGWNAAVTLAAYLGDQLNGEMITLHTYYADEVPDAVRKNDHLLLVGRPSKMPLYSELTAAMPGPVDLSTDRVEPRGQVLYRFSDESSIGNIQLFRSPWNNERAVLAVFGNTDPGVKSAEDALVISELRNRLVGNFTEIVGGQLLSLDTRIGAATVAEQVPPQATVVGSESIVLDPYPTNRASWLFPAIISGLSLIVLIILGVVITSLRKK